MKGCFHATQFGKVNLSQFNFLRKADPRQCASMLWDNFLALIFEEWISPVNASEAAVMPVILDSELFLGLNWDYRVQGEVERKPRLK